MSALGRKGGIASGQSRRSGRVVLNMGRSPEAKEARVELVAETKERLEELLPRAFEVLEANLELGDEHPKIAQDAALAIVAYVLGKPGQELTVKGDREPKVIFWNHPAVHYASKLKAALEARPAVELDSD
jgi:hypothetical protein